MATANSPHVEDLVSVGSRVSWSAILAGAAVALATHFLLGILAAAAGWSLSGHGTEEGTQTRTMVLTVALSCIALFAGGVVATQLTAGENKVEAAIYGIVMWAVVMAVMAHGAMAGRGALAGLLNDTTHGRSWEADARRAGVPAEQIDQWRTKTAETSRTANVDVRTDSRLLWSAFTGIWLSMFAATVGALVGAGPTFRLVRIARPRVL
jgi:hypothetical protein